MKEVIKFIDVPVEERQKWNFLDEFSSEFIKALSKTSYYMPGHPSAQKAKEGLFEKLGRLIAGDRLLTYSRDIDERKKEIYVSGIFEGNVFLKDVMGGEKGKVYVPKLWEFMQRKRLISVTIKPEVTYKEFDEFLNLLAEAPQESFTEEKTKKITHLFVERGLVNILPVFEEDILEERRIHWLVRIALSRLRKDLRLLPLFKNLPEEKVIKIKKQVFKDIVRPLKRVDLLMELIEHTDLVRKDVKLISGREVEREIMRNVGPKILNPLAKEMVNRLQEYKDKDPFRYKNIIVALEYAIERFAEIGDMEAQDTLSYIYNAGYITLESLPPQIRRFVKIRAEIMGFLKSRRLARELFVEVNKERFEEKIVTFKGLFEELLRMGKEPLALEIIDVLESLMKSEEIKWKKELAEKVLKRIVSDDKVLGLLSGLLMEGKEVEKIMRIFSIAGEAGIEFMFEVLRDAEDKRVRLKVLQILKENSDRTVTHVLSLLRSSKGEEWHFIRNLIFLLNELGENGSAHIIREYLHHPHKRVREEALMYMLRTKPYDTLDEILPLLDDPSYEVRIKVAYALGSMKSKKREVVVKCIERLMIEDEKDEIKEVIINMFSALGNLKLPDGRTIEDVLISLLHARKKKMLFFVEESISDRLKVAIIKALSEIGGKKSVFALREIKSKHLEEEVHKALKKIAHRFSSRG